MRRVLARRDMRLYVAGQTLSLFGDTALWLALAVWAKSLTGSSAAAGMVMFALAAPQLLAPLSGLLVDRVRRRPLLIAANLAIAAAVLPLLAVLLSGSLPVVLAGKVLFGVGIPWVIVALYTLLQRTTPAPLQGRVYSAVEVFVGTPQTISIALGAILVALIDYRALLLVEALVVAGAGLWLLTRVQASH
jgi:MFS family permease